VIDPKAKDPLAVSNFMPIGADLTRRCQTRCQYVSVIHISCVSFHCRLQLFLRTVSILRRMPGIYDMLEAAPPALEIAGYEHPEALHSFYIVSLY
jgi:hypothetical protein